MAEWKVDIDRNRLAAYAQQRTVRFIARSMVRTTNRAIVLTPVATGLLRSRTQMRMTSTSGNTISGEVFNDTEYAIYVHEGTRYMKSRPFLFRALRQTLGRSGFIVTRERVG